MKHSLFSRAARLLACFSVAAIAVTSLASANTTLTFQEDGNPGPDWTIWRYSGNDPLIQSTLHGKDWLLFARTTTSNNASQVIYNGGDANNSGVDSQIGDLSGKVIIGANRWEAAYASTSVILRAGTAGFKTETAYHLVVNANGIGLYWGIRELLTLPLPPSPPDLEPTGFLALAPLPTGFELGTSPSTTIINTCWSSPS